MVIDMKDAPKETTNFSVLGLDSRLLQAVAQQNFNTPTPVQARAIPLVLEGKDVLGTSITPKFWKAPLLTSWVQLGPRLALARLLRTPYQFSNRYYRRVQSVIILSSCLYTANLEFSPASPTEPHLPSSLCPAMSLPSRSRTQFRISQLFVRKMFEQSISIHSTSLRKKYLKTCSGHFSRKDQTLLLLRLLVHLYIYKAQHFQSNNWRTW